VSGAYIYTDSSSKRDAPSPSRETAPTLGVHHCTVQQRVVSHCTNTARYEARASVVWAQYTNIRKWGEEGGPTGYMLSTENSTLTTESLWRDNEEYHKDHECSEEASAMDG